MATTTTTYAFVKPEPGGDDDVWGDLLNGDFDVLDTLFRNTFDSPSLHATTGHLGTIKSTRIPSTIIGARVLQSTGATPKVTIDRTDSNINSMIAYRGVLDSVVSTVYAGMGSVDQFCVGPDNNLSSNAVFRVNTLTGAVSWTGLAAGDASATRLTAGTLPNARLAGSYSFANLTLTGALIAADLTLDAGAVNDPAILLGTGVPVGLYRGGNALRVSINNVTTAYFTENGITADLFTGSGANLTSMSASQLTSGTLPNARLSGTYSFGALSVDNVTVPKNSAGGYGLRFDGDGDRISYSVGNDAMEVRVNNTVKMSVSQLRIEASGGAVFTGPGGGLTGLTNLAASELTGTISPARLPTSNTERDRVLDLLSNAAVGAVGTTCFLRVAPGVTLTPGQLVAASALSYAGTKGDGSITWASSPSPSGQWRCMGAIPDGSANGATTFLRVS